MKITQKKEGSKLTVSIDGRIDTATSPKLYEYLTAEMEGVMELTLDFAKVEYVSSAGLRALLAIKKDLAAKGKQFEICHLNNICQEVFKVTGFINVLTVK